MVDVDYLKEDRYLADGTSLYKLVMGCLLSPRNQDER